MVVNLYSSITISLSQFLTGVVGAFTIGVGAIPMMLPIDQSKREILIYLMQGPVWALFSTHLNFKATASHCLRSLLGTWLASAFGCFYYFLVQLMCGGTVDNYQREAAIAFVIPTTFVIALTHQSSGCKLREVIGFEAAASSFFTPVALFLDKPYEEALVNSIMESYGIIVSLATIVFLEIFGLLPTRTSSPIKDFDLAAADFFDRLSTSIVSGNKQAATLDAAQAKFEEAVAKASASTKSPKIRSMLWRMASFLYSLRKSIAEGCYPESIVRRLWKPSTADLLDLRCAIRRGLLSDDEADPSNIVDVKERAAALKTSFREASLKLKDTVHCSDELVTMEEIARYNFAEESVLHFSYIVTEYITAKNEEMAKLGRSGKGVHSLIVVQWFNDFVDFLVHWWKEPFFESNGMTTWEKLIYPAKLTLTATLTSTVILLWGRAQPFLMSHVFWGFIAALFCMLPNTGATLSKVTRRIAGTVCALVLAVICIFANPFNKAAFFVELLIVAFIGKLGSTFPLIGYGGPVFVLTWVIVAFQPSVSMIQPEEDTLWGIGWRMALTLVGVTMTSVLSLLVFPVLASLQLKDVSQDTLKEQAKYVVEAIRQLALLADDKGAIIRDSREELGESLSRNSTTRASLQSDAYTEVVVFGQWIMSGKDKRILEAQKTLDALARSTVCAYGASVTCGIEIEQPATSAMLKPVAHHLSELATALERSSAELQLCLSGDSGNDVDAIEDDVHLAMLRCRDGFNESREMLISKFREGSVPFNEVVDSGGSILYHAVYALNIFTEEWNSLEAFLAGRKSTSNFDSDPASEVSPVSSSIGSWVIRQ